MREIERSLATALLPCLSNQKFRRVISTRKLEKFVTQSLDSFGEIDNPSKVILQFAFSRLKVNWHAVNTQLIRLIHESEEEIETTRKDSV